MRAVEVEAESAGALGDDLRRREFQMIIDTLRAERGRRKEAAERLGISPRTLRYKLAQMRDAGMDVEGLSVRHLKVDATTPSCGSWLAREAECSRLLLHAAFASKPAPTGFAWSG